MNFRFYSLLTLFSILSFNSIAQPGTGTKWALEGDAYYIENQGSIIKFDLKTQKYFLVIDANKFIPKGQSQALELKNFNFTTDQSQLLIFTNSKKVWRYETRGDYWVLNLKTNELKQLGKTLPESTLMFAKISPNGQKAAYVSNRNIYVEDIASGKIKQLTQTKGNPNLINGTFDWAYEEELSCYDGFRWSPDSKRIAYWQLDASGIKYFNMINNTDDIYSKVIPIEYPKVGVDPSSCRIGVMDIKKGKTKWMSVPGDSRQHYIPRMEWAGNNEELMIQQLDRKQQVSKIMYANAKTGDTKTIFEENDEAWIEVRTIWHDDNPSGWEWINDGREFLWATEKDGWNHLYKISRDGKDVRLVTSGAYDIIDPLMYDEKTDNVYFTASPDNSMQKYLYRVSVSNKGEAERITPENQEGTNMYLISANGKFALHTFENYYTPTTQEWVTLPNHKALDEAKGVNNALNPAKKAASNIEFVEVTTKSGIKVEGWMALPKDFDPNKKYATVFYVYAEPAKMTSQDTYNAGILEAWQMMAISTFL
jgi:dipeptidyl-peptidase-4